jgi:hypothetical protein
MFSFLKLFPSKRYSPVRLISEEEKSLTNSEPSSSSSSELAIRLSERDDLILQIKKLKLRLRLAFLALIFSLTCLVALIAYSTSLAETKPRQPPQTSCGTSIEEAKSLNCSFDILSKAWLPAHCTRLGSEEYLRDSWSWNHTGWGIYQDRAQTRELTMEELMAYADSGLKWYGTEREHLVHCAWGLKRVLDAYVTGKRMDHIIQQLHHTTHCVDRLYMSAVKAPDLDVVLGKGNIRFGLC